MGDINKVVCSLQISLGSAYGISMTNFAYMKSVQDGCQESLPKCTSVIRWRSINTYLTPTTMKAKPLGVGQNNHRS